GRCALASLRSDLRLSFAPLKADLDNQDVLTALLKNFLVFVTGGNQGTIELYLAWSEQNGRQVCDAIRKVARNEREDCLVAFKASVRCRPGRLLASPAISPLLPASPILHRGERATQRFPPR